MHINGAWFHRLIGLAENWDMIYDLQTACGIGSVLVATFVRGRPVENNQMSIIHAVLVVIMSLGPDRIDCMQI